MKETAEILNCSEQKVRVDYHRALKQLQNKLVPVKEEVHWSMKNFEEYIIETLKSHPEKAALEESKQKLKNRLKEEAVHIYRPQKFSYKFRYGLLTAITFFLFLSLLWGDGVGQLQKGIEGFFSQGKEETRNKEDSSPLYQGNIPIATK